MGVQFFESMSGELFDADGRPHHVAIDLRCDASKAGRLALDGLARASGTIRALPWADGAACTGTVTLKPVIGRRLDYDVVFRGADGADWRLFGRKSVSVRHPVATMTTMQARLERSGELVAEGRMQFFLNDLPSFLASWRPRSSVRGSLDAGDAAEWSGGAVLNDRERATLGAFAETIIHADEVVPASDEVTVAAAEEVLRHMPPMLLWAYRTGLRSLDAAARGRHGKGFARLDPRRRRALVDRLTRSSTLAGESMVLALGMPVKMAHFSRRDYLDAAGLPDYRNPVSEPQSTTAEPRWLQSVTAPEAMDRSTTVECDVVVIGSGAGGAAVAASLAERGMAVAIMEEGRYVPRAQLAGGPEQRMLKYWRDGGMNMVIGNAPLAVPTGRLVGGTTAINSGTCFRTPDEVLAEWRADGFPADFEPGRFGAYLDRVEKELQVAPGDPRYLGRIADVVAKGATEMGGHHGPLHRNAPACDGQGLCFVGCPTGAKRGSDISWVPRALRAGAALYTGLPVTRVLMSGNRAAGVLAEGQDRYGAPRRLEIRAGAVVIAAGTLLTPLLLRNNGISLPWIGRNLSIHPALGAMAMFAEPDRLPWQAIPQGYFVDGLFTEGQGDDRIRFEGGYMHPQLAAPSLPFDGPELTRWMSAWSRVEQFGFMTRDTGVGTVRPGPGGRPLITYSVTPRVLASFQKGSAALAELLIRGGAAEVATRIEGVGTVRNIYEARDILRRKLAPRHFRGMGFHPLGTARMGIGPDRAVVDFEHRVFGTQGLYVADGSSVPSSLGVNPQVTIMAMALRAADIIASQ